jgi:hypothetical protein
MIADALKENISLTKLKYDDENPEVESRLAANKIKLEELASYVDKYFISGDVPDIQNNFNGSLHLYYKIGKNLVKYFLDKKIKTDAKQNYGPVFNNEQQNYNPVFNKIDNFIAKNSLDFNKVHEVTDINSSPSEILPNIFMGLDINNALHNNKQNTVSTETANNTEYADEITLALDEMTLAGESE